MRCSCPCPVLSHYWSLEKMQAHTDFRWFSSWWKQEKSSGHAQLRLKGWTLASSRVHVYQTCVQEPIKAARQRLEQAKNSRSLTQFSETPVIPTNTYIYSANYPLIYLLNKFYQLYTKITAQCWASFKKWGKYTNKRPVLEGNWNSYTNWNNQNTGLTMTSHEGGQYRSQRLHLTKFSSRMAILVCLQSPFKGHKLYGKSYCEKNKIKNSTDFWLDEEARLVKVLWCLPFPLNPR